MKSFSFGKILSVVAIFMLSLFVPAIWGQPAPVQPTPANGIGSPNPGTAGNPYHVSTLAELYWISQNASDWDKHYVQTANIDASSTSGWNAGAGWEPIGEWSTKFTGAYDGGGFTISDLFIDRPSTTLVGLFGETDGAVLRRIGLLDVNVTGENNVGALVGYMGGGTIDECFVRSGTVTATNSGSGFVGGMAGQSASGAVISDVHAIVTVTNTDNDAAASGLIGQYNSSTINRAYAAGAVHSGASFFFLRRAIGQQSGSACNECYFDSDVNPSVSAGLASGRTTAEMQQQATFTNFDFQCETANGTNNIWGIDEGNDYPVLSAFGYSQTCPVVDVAGSASANGSYITLKAAFDAINANTQTAANDIVITLTGSTFETASAVLNEGAWNSLIIYPTTAGVSISGNLAAPLIDLNGADRVAIDGRVNATGASKSLIIENENTTLVTGNSTIRLIEGAQNNIIRYAIIRSAAYSDYANETSGAADNFGIITPALGAICFHNGTATGGNSNNLVEYCDLTNSGGNRPYALITSVGSGVFANNNQNNIIRNNHFFDFEAMRQGGAIIIRTGSREWEITDNHFFQPNTITYKGDANVSRMVFIQNGRNYKINRNFFGGTAPNAGGGKYIVEHATNDVGFNIISITSEETIGITEIKNNIFRNFDLSAGNINNSFISGFSGHPLVIADNEIGVQNATGDILLRGASFRGIITGPTSTTGDITDTIRGNTIGGIEHTVSGGSLSFYGIHSFANFVNSSHRARNLVVINNTIGSPTQAESIKMANATASESCLGMYFDFNGVTRTVVIENNTISNLFSQSNSTVSELNGLKFIRRVAVTAEGNSISNLSSNSLRTTANPTGFNSSSAVVGINSQTIVNSIIRGNTVHTLSLTSANAPGQIIGIARFNGDVSTTNELHNNFIHSFSIPSPGASAEITGMFLATNNTTRNVSNNIIRLGGDVDYAVTGIRQTNTTGNLYFNTVYIDGTVAGGTAKSYCMRIEGGATNAVKDMRNNILENVRSTTGGSSQHYALGLINYTATTNTTLDFNNYRAQGTGGVLAEYNSTDQALPDFENPAWNSNSLSSDPQFANAGGVAPADYHTAVNLSGTPIPGITEDFFGSFRSVSSPNMGAYEATGPVVVSFSTGADGIYTTLKAAFDAINANPTQTGNTIQMRINQNTTETASAVLNAGDWESVRIFPTTTGLRVSGTINSGALIRLNGADSVIVDGRVNMTGDTLALELENLSTSSNSGTSTITFINGAQNNIFRHCTIKGYSVTSGGGTIFFTISSSGPNSGNRFERNMLTGRTLAVVNSVGSTSVNNNSQNYFIANQFYDFLRPQFNSFGVIIDTWSADYHFIGNHFYETSTFVPTSTGAYTFISSSWGNAANRIFIIGNYFGGSAPFAGGTAFTKLSATNNALTVIRSNAGTNSEISSNVITNIDWTNSAGAAIAMIQVESGENTMIGGSGNGNIIGSATNPDALRFINNAPVRGVFLTSATSTAGRSVSHNTIAGIRTQGASAIGASNLIAIQHESSTGNIDSNIIGTIDAPLRSEGAATGVNQHVIGVFSGDASGGATPVRIRYNQISHLYNATTNTTIGGGKTYGIFTVNANLGYIIEGNTVHDLFIANPNNQEFHTQVSGTNVKLNAAAPSLIGICLVADASSQHQVRNNTVYNLNQTLSTFDGTIYGIYFGSGTNANNIIDGNFVHSLNTEPTAVGAKIRGIMIRTGASGSVNYTASNNLVALDNNLPVEIGGILDYSTSTGTRRMFNNTVYIAGSPASGTHNSYGIYNSSSAGTRNYQNNIVVNARSGNGNHYAHFINYAAFGNNTVHILNSNVYYTPGTNGIVGNINNTDYVTLQDWRTISGKEQLSKSADPGFANPGGLQILDYLPSDPTLVSSGVGLTTDILGVTRANNSRGAIEYATVPPVTVNATAGLATADYTSFKAAMDAINNGTHEGVIDVEVNASVQEANASILYQTGFNGTANYTAVRIYPTSADVVLLGNLSATMFHLSGADSITIDGRINRSGTGRNLSFVNINQFNGALRLSNGCENNIIRNTIFEGQADGADATRRGIVMINTSSAGANQNNLFLNNGITSNAGSLRAIAAFDVFGSTAPNNNVNNSIIDNDFYNHFRTNATSFGIRIAQNSDNFTINGNSFFETGVFSSSTNNVTLTAIDIDNTSGLDYTIRGNYIGGSASQCGGGAFTYTNSSSANFLGIRLNANVNSNLAVDSNSVAGFSWTSSSGSWVGIRRQAGRAYIGNNEGNHIGDLSANSVSVTTGGTFSLFGIESQGLHEIEINNNALGGISGIATSTNSFEVSGIRASSLSGTMTVEGNIIGSSAAPLVSSAQSTAISGMDLFSGGTRSVRRNRVEGVTNTNPAFTGFVYGIRTPAGIISENFVTGLNVDAASSGARVYGVNVIGTASATAQVHNNIVSLSGNADALWIGLFDAISVNREYLHNTVYLSGSTSGTEISAALRSSSTSGVREYRNNILVNTRSGGGNQYGTYFSPSSTADLTLEFNAYWPTGTNAHIGFFGGQPYETIADWQGAIGADFISKTTDPGFANAGGSNPLDYLPSSTALGGSVTSIGTDYSGATRTFFAIGALDFSVPSPITVNATVGTATANYTTLHDAFEAINDGTHQGDIEIELSNGVFESAQAVLYESGYNATSSYNRVDIYPVASDVRIVGAFTNGAVVLLDGADMVTFDGRVNRSGSNPSMEIINSAVTNNTGVYTIVLQNGAQDNVLRYLGLKGAMFHINQTTLANNVGVVAFLGTNNATPNSNNIIEYNRISGLSATNRPTSGLFSAGTASYRNSHNSVRFNDFKNLFNPTSLLGYHIAIADNNNEWTIEGNHFYEEETLSTSASSEQIYSFVWLQPFLSGEGFIVKDNFMGGTAPNAGGGPLTKNNTTTSRFYGIYMSLRTSAGVGSSVESEVTGNIIRNFDWANSNNSGFYPIFVSRGKVKVGAPGQGNIIGDTAATSIVVTNGVNGAIHYGIYGNNTADNGLYLNISHNVIAGLSFNTTASTSGASFYGVYVGHRARIEHNIIGSTVPSSIHLTSTSTSGVQNMYGIWSSPVSNHTSIVKNNIVRNLTNATSSASSGTSVGIYSWAFYNTVDSNQVYNLSIASNKATKSITVHNGEIINSPALIGILAPCDGDLGTINANKVYNLHLTNSNAAGTVAGIMSPISGFSAPAYEVQRNYVTNLFASGSGDLATMYGIWQATYGISTTVPYDVYSNIVSIGGNTNAEVIAYYDSVANTTSNLGQIYFNTFHVHGSQVGGSKNSAAGYFALGHPTNIRNTIFSNQRISAGGNGSHYAVDFRYSTGTNLTLDYNNYSFSSAGGELGRLVNSPVSSLPIFSGKDANSISENPQFQLGTLPDYKNFFPVVPNTGVAIAGITDYLLTTRNNPPTMGALESLTWVGTADTDYDNAANWRGGVVPAPDDVVTFDLNPVNDLVLDQNRTIRQINNGNSTYVVRLNGFELNLTGNLVFANGAFLDGTTANSRLVLSGSNPQPIPSGAFEQGKLYNLTVRNPTGISLQADTLEIVNQLRVDSGMVTLSNALLIAGNISGANSDTTYIRTNGSARLGAILANGASFTFPVGSSTYNPLTVTNNTGLTDTFAVQVRNGVLDAATAGPVVSNPRVDRIWGIRKYNPNAGSGVDFEFQWYTAHQDGAITDFYLNYFDGTNWTIPVVGGRTVDTSTVNRKLTITGYTGTFSDFSIGGDPVNPLPVELVAFNGTCNEMEHVLNWITASEVNNFRFVVERSVDGLEFQPVGEQAGAGTTAELTTYTFNIPAQSRNEYFYRLIQEDFDGVFKVYPALALTCMSDVAHGLIATVFPNPSSANSSLQVNSARERSVWVQISDAMGRPVHTKELIVAEGTNLFGLPGYSLSAGVYTISLRSEGETRTLKWVRN